MMKSPGTIPKFNRIMLVFSKEFPKFSRDCGQLDLIWVDWWVEDSLCSMYWVYDNGNAVIVYYLGSLINAASDSKKFCFYGSDVWSYDR